MSNTKEFRKEIAIKCLDMLNIYGDYKKAFKAKKQTVTMFERFGGYWATADNGHGFLEDKIRSVEDENNVTVYAVIHNFTGFGECYSMLCVPTSCKTIDDTLEDYGDNTFVAFAYVWNKTYDDCSEFGDIAVRPKFGGIEIVG